MTNSKGSANEDIGRPGPWKEGRYQRPGDPSKEGDSEPPGGDAG